ncbi:hypothetical protein CRENBAI_010645 [Crenichthys baileyi]|uniref:Uncharacterized protein n=1 Tax=Crenichthys baileyi TaxID=28760 RepID=A0AAV9S5K9_9TELE
MADKCDDATSRLTIQLTQKKANDSANLGPRGQAEESTQDCWVQRQMEEAMRHLPKDLEVLPSPLLLEQMEREAAQRQRVWEGCSVTPPQLRHSPPASVLAAKPSSSCRRKKRRRRAPSCVSAGEEESPMAADETSGAVVSLPAGGRVAASNPASSSATVLSPRLATESNPASSSATALSARFAAAPPMLSSLAPARCSEATPDELEQRLRFYARQIKSFRTTSIMYSSPVLMERIRQMERDYETAVRQFYCRPPPSSPGLQGAAATEQPTPGL